jgi:DNA-binding Lrp family transcriptional regulator
MKTRSENPKNEGPFAWQTREAAVEAGKLGINAYAIYCALTHFQSAAASEHKRRFSASYEQLAEHVGCSRGTVKTALDALEKAGLIRKFSGSNGAHRATRNAFFLTSISSTPDGRGSTPDERHVSTRGERHVSTQFGRFREKENNYSAPPKAAAGVVENKESEPACPPLTGGSGSKKQMPDISHLSEQQQNYIRAARAQAEESDRIIAERRAAKNFEDLH